MTGYRIPIDLPVNECLRQIKVIIPIKTKDLLPQRRRRLVVRKAVPPWKVIVMAFKKGRPHRVRQALPRSTALSEKMIDELAKQSEMHAISQGRMELKTRVRRKAT